MNLQATRAILSDDAPRYSGYSISPNQPALAAALDAICHWRNPEELAAFALARHGYCDTDGFFGVTYPDDLDEYDRLISRENIPEGFVEIIAWYGEHHGPSHLLEEKVYLEILRQYLSLCGEAEAAQRLLRG